MMTILNTIFEEDQIAGWGLRKKIFFGSAEIRTILIFISAKNNILHG